MLMSVQVILAGMEERVMTEKTSTHAHAGLASLELSVKRVRLTNCHFVERGRWINAKTVKLSQAHDCGLAIHVFGRD